jgi:YbbR-like protein
MIEYFRQLVFKDFWLKLFSLGLATLIWFTVSFVIQKEGSSSLPASLLTKRRVFYNLPVVVVSAAADVRNFKVTPDEVSVTVEGDTKIVDNLQSREIRPVVDLTGLEPVGPFRRHIDVSTPMGVAYVDVSPESVDVIIPTDKERKMQ